MMASKADQADVAEAGADPTPQGQAFPPSLRDKSVSVYLDREDHKRLKVLSVEHETGLQALGEQALEPLLEHYRGRAPARRVSLG
ncbi:MAG: hypothetical protein OXN92_04795 [Gammaproteobacteria bacterium]|nr:hypothetical protein [Gammaproteobacteria bacterium]